MMNRQDATVPTRATLHGQPKTGLRLEHRIAADLRSNMGIFLIEYLARPSQSAPNYMRKSDDFSLLL
jgi:hypothetical protein